MKYGNASYLRKLTHEQLTTPDFFINEVLGGKKKINLPTHHDFGIITSKIVEGMDVDEKFFINGPRPIIDAVANFTHALFLSRVEAKGEEKARIAGALKRMRLLGEKLRGKARKASGELDEHIKSMSGLVDFLGTKQLHFRKLFEEMGDEKLLTKRAYRKLAKVGLKKTTSFVGHVAIQGVNNGSSRILTTHYTGA